jgi:hypothetical protein
MIAAQGFEIRPRFLPGSRVEAILSALASSGNVMTGRAGRRDVAEVFPEVGFLSREPVFVDAASEILGSPAFCVRTLYFDKTADANWKVAWHQDLTIRVAERRDIDGFGPWSRKDGIDHVQPPTDILERMITLRLHLDDCTSENGALRVLPGSHAHGRLAVEEIEQWRSRTEEVTCEVPAGGVLLMRPLLLHASSPAVVPRHRRVLHFEYACSPLPGGLDWYSGKRKL